jgi:hypothetical protein
MTTVNQLQEKQAARAKEIETENRLEAALYGLTGIIPSIVSPDSHPFATKRFKAFKCFIYWMAKLGII